MLDVRDALLGINQLLDDLLEDTTRNGGLRPPESAEPASPRATWKPGAGFVSWAEASISCPSMNAYPFSPNAAGIAR